MTLSRMMLSLFVLGSIRIALAFEGNTRRELSIRAVSPAPDVQPPAGDRRIDSPRAGDPTQDADQRIEHDQGEVEIVVYNRAILLFTPDSEAVKRIHQVCCGLADLAVRHHRA